jgi:hypothetical protein
LKVGLPQMIQRQRTHSSFLLNKVYQLHALANWWTQHRL